ncbi:MAG: hypothetical protein ACMXYL_04290 [Candidatus Woesearchaeota archaeon]
MSIETKLRDITEWNSRQYYIKGVVNNIRRANPISEDGLSQMIVLSLEVKDAKNKDYRIVHVDYPLETKSDMELMPYQDILSGQLIRYTKTNEADKHDIRSSTWTIELLTGRLDGNKYSHSRLYHTEH